MTRVGGWRTRDGLILVGLVLLAIAATFPTWAEIFHQALRNEEDSHILIVVPIALWLAWLRRGRLRGARPSWSIAGTGLVLAGIALERVGFSTSLDVARHGGVLLTVVGAGVTVIGLDTVKRLFPSFAALAFMIPVPGRVRLEIAGPLQSISARIAQGVLDLFGVPVIRSGNALNINGVDVAIAEACNGMRMVAALALIAFAFIFSVPMRNSVRLIILAASPVIAVIVNVARLAPTVLLYGYASESTANLFHDLSGWAALAVALALLWGLLAILRWIEVRIDPFPVGR